MNSTYLVCYDSQYKINAKLQYFASESCRKHHQGLLICAETLYNCIRAVKVRKSVQHEINAKVQHFAAEMYRNESNVYFNVKVLYSPEI